MVKRERWIESDLVSLSDEEQDNFEHKSGKLFDSGRDSFLNTLAKALSAFSNSGGGTILIGVADDGTFDGIVPTVGRDKIRDWIEKQVPVITDYPLADFRVHTLQRGQASQIPVGREIIVIDVGDSTAAPHQSKRDKLYYRREGGRSVPAPHFYLELLRQRLTNPVLTLALDDVTFCNAFEPISEDALFLVCKLHFLVKNIGRVSANNWQVNFRYYRLEETGYTRESDVSFSRFPTPKIPRSFSTSMNMGSRAILPECNYIEEKDVGFYLRPRTRTKVECVDDLQRFLSSLVVGCQVATETSPGIVEEINTKNNYNAEKIIDDAFVRYPEFFIDQPSA